MKTITSLLFIFSAIGQAGVIQVDLENVALSGAPGDTLHYFATFTNTSLTETVTFAGTSTTAIDSRLTIDTTPVVLNGPASLGPGEVFSSFGVWDVGIDPATPAGPYIGNSVSLFGFVDDGVNSTFADVADVTFDVNVTGSSAPEPATILLLATGFAAIALSRKR